jgi:hypothetical protein
VAGNDDIRELINRFDARLERNDQVIERNTQAFERNTRAWGKTVAALDSIRDSIEDMSADIRAHTEAIFKMLDRLDGGEQQA